MDVALVLDQVEDRAFDPSQGSAHDGLSADANVGSLIGTRHRQPDRSLHDARRLKVPLRPDNPGLSGIIQWCVECGRKYCGQSSKVSKTVNCSECVAPVGSSAPLPISGSSSLMSASASCGHSDARGRNVQNCQEPSSRFAFSKISLSAPPWPQVPRSKISAGCGEKYRTLLTFHP